MPIRAGAMADDADVPGVDPPPAGRRAVAQAVGPADLAVTQGDTVRLRFDPAHAAVLSRDQRVGSSGTIDP